MSANSQIKIQGIKCNLIIGCLPYERNISQELIIDLNVFLYTHNWHEKDNLNTTISYDDLIDMVKQVVATTKFNLLESLAQYLTNELFRIYKLIAKIDLTLTKPALFGIKADKISFNYVMAREFNIALSLGSNTSNSPMQQLVNAIEFLGEFIDEIRIGGFYETKPYGFTEQNNFYNTAIVGKCSILPHELLAKTKTIEKLMNKQEVFINGPRVIDIDLLLFDDWIYNKQFLGIPHKDLAYRDFVLVPLADVAISWLHPQLGHTIGELLAKLDPKEATIIRNIVYKK